MRFKHRILRHDAYMNRILIGMLGFNDSALLAAVRDYFSSRPEVRLYARTSYGFANQAESQHFDGLIVRACQRSGSFF